MTLSFADVPGRILKIQRTVAVRNLEKTKQVNRKIGKLPSANYVAFL